MKVTVFNGSPKGDMGITIQYVKYLEKKFPDHSFTMFHVAQKISTLEKDEAAFQEILDSVKEADLVLWAFPIYVLLLPSQYKRFIELIFERGAVDYFRNKHTATLCTSIHFYDNIGLSYMRAICDDLEMQFAGSFSPDMDDLFEESERTRLVDYADNIFFMADKGIPGIRHYTPLPENDFVYEPAASGEKVDQGDMKILLLTDCTDESANIGKMVKRYAESFTGSVEVVNIFDIGINGGCTGCLQCALDYECMYKGKDEYIDFYNEKVIGADGLVFAGKITDRYLSWKWKQFFDRSFFNTHTPTIIGKQLGYLVSGPFSRLDILGEIFQAYAEFQGSNPVAVVSDESISSEELDRNIMSLARKMVIMGEKKYVGAQTFLGVGGTKIFRDDIWGRLRFVFQADHRYYDKNGFYDFPQYDERSIQMNESMMKMMEDPEAKEGIRKNLRVLQSMPHRKIVDKA